MRAPAVVWFVVRLVATAILVVVVLVAAGSGELVLDALDTALVGDRWQLPRSGGRTAGPEASRVVAALVGAAVAVIDPTRRAVRQLVTLLHELGHTLVAAALGARPRGIVLRHDASGHATARWVGRPTLLRRLALAVVAFAGLPAAAVTAAAGADLLHLAGAEAVLWCLAGAGLTVAVLARSAWSLLIAVGLAALAVAALSDAAEPWAAAVVTAVLVATAVRTSLDGLRALRAPIAAGDDARVVGRQLHLPARLVQLLQTAALVAGSGWTLWLLTVRLGPST